MGRSARVLLLFAFWVPVAPAQTPVNLRQAIDAIQAKDYAKAIAILETEVRRSPDREEAHYYLGLAYWQVERKTDAVTELKRAKQLSPKNPEYSYALGNFYLQQKSYAEARAVYTEGLKQKDNGRSLYGLGLVYLAQDSLDQAITYLLQSREASPNDSKVYRAIGDAYAKQKVLSLAIDNYQKTVEIEPGWLEVHFTLGKLYFKERRVNEALASYKKAVELDPTNADAQYEVGNLYVMAKRPADAVAYLEAHVKLQPNSYKGQYALAKALYSTRRLPEAVTNAEQAYRLDPTADALELLAKVYFDSRDSTGYRKSSESFEKLSQTNGYEFDAATYLQWGRALFRLKRFADAIPKYEASLRMDSTQTDVYFELGSAYISQQRFDDAINSFNHKIRLSPEPKSRADSVSLARAYFNMGMAYMRKQTFAQATATFRSGLRYEGAYTQAWIWLAQSYGQADSSEASKAAYDEVLRLDANHTEANRMVGVYYLVKKQFDVAIPFLRKAVHLDPGNEMGHLWLAQAFHSTSKVPEAKAEYALTLKINPKNEQAQKGMKLLETFQ